MKFRRKYIFWGLVFCLTLGTYGSSALSFVSREEIPLMELSTDTTDLVFPVAKTVPDNYKDLETNHPIDLRTPRNLDSTFQYNPVTNRYELRTKIGNENITTPLTLTSDEYFKYSLQKSMDAYYKDKYREDFLGKGEDKKDALSPFGFNFDIGPADKIFGPGGVKLNANGSVLTKIGLTHTSNGNPTLTERQRNRTAFDFDTQIQADISASVGDKLNFDLNYNTESTFDFDTRKLKLGYNGKEDEIVKVLEAGNVSMNTTNSLIRGGTSLFGIKTELQFGKLTVGAIFSQQESKSRSITSRGNVQTTPFEVFADQYEENMHYFLAYHFHDNYDEAMSSLPYVKSGINIDRIEVWITNRRSDYSEARNIIAFADLAEHNKISNTVFTQPTGQEDIPYNNANDLYTNLVNNYSGIRDIAMVNPVLGATPLEGGHDFEKIENARKLSLSEYSVNTKLGYISLNYPLQPDEVLAVAFTYTYRGKVYQVGEFSTDNPTNTKSSLFLKLLKGTTVSPANPTWRLMMKNIYPITGNQYLDPSKFRLDIKYLNDTTGTYLNYIKEGNIANKMLLRVENLDRLDSRNEPYPDGFFDFVDSFTVIRQTGKIIFPVVEPFGSHLRKMIGNDLIADKYVFQELYDSTLTVARQTAEKNKFILQGEFKGSKNLSGGFGNVDARSVVVTANGVRLREGSDYIYANGIVTIINPAYENANIQQSFEENSGFDMQRKTMMGLNLNYAINPKFNIGATIMNLSEMPLTMKVEPGMESINNTLFGFNVNYATQSQFLTNLLDKLPLIDLTQPSQITFTAEYAHLLPGHYQSKYGGNYAYIDDFEQSKQTIDLRSPYSWSLSSTPSMFEDAKKSNNIDYGKNRSQLAWYHIDAMFTRKSTLTPTHLKNDLDQLSNHFVREVPENELFPNKDQKFTESATIPIMNVAFYPQERGPYNLDATGMNADGTLTNPRNRWGGIMRRIESGQVDFEANNIETIEFWLLDPFVYNSGAQGGDMYINLGEISEDILKDEKKFFENGLPIDGDTTKVEKTVWGLVPRQQSMVYAFDNAEGARKIQDVGLNGLSTEAEFSFPTYMKYLEELQNVLSPETKQAMMNNPFSPLRDPAGDNYHFFRGSDYDEKQMPILERYKHYNGVEGNSADASDTGESFNSAYRLTPDVEDINQDNTLNESEKYFQYKISIRPEDMVVGKNYIVQKKIVKPYLKNGKDETVAWYQFKVPLSEYEKPVGNINDFKTIRFMRMFLTNFSDSVILRFGTFELVYGQWRTYTKDLSNPNLPPQGNASISMTVVNYEEHSSKEPVNYVMPPGVNRIIDPGQTQLRQQNEQSLSLTILDLSPGDARAIYKSSGLDSRQYRRLQMFAHAERLIDDLGDLQDDDLSIFLRLGSDYKNHYYEYEVPLKLTPSGQYNEATESRRIVWPDANMIDFPLELLTDLKLARNKDKRKAGSDVNYYTPYSSFDPEKPMNKVTVLGNPTLSDVKVIMIGVRNNSRNAKSAEVWFNELRLTDFNEDGGWAGNANLFVGLSDMGSVNVSGKKETAGFGSLDQGIMDRNIDDMHQYSIATQVDIGRFFPEKAKVNIPFYYSYSENIVSPKYNPLDQDVLLKDALDVAETKAEKDSIKNYSLNKETNRSINFNNVKVDILSKKPMPYDPANFTFGYSSVENNIQNASTQYEKTTEDNLSLNYLYSSPLKPWKPFDKQEKKTNSKPGENAAKQNQNTPGKPASANSQASGGKQFLKNIEIGLLPNSLQINSEIYRNYYEVQLRDLGSEGGINMIPASFREDFFWNRSLETQWKLTKNLNFTFNSGTNARIEAPHVQVNRMFNPDEYSLWKDSVLQSIRDLGNPMEYKQTFSVNYTIPFNMVPAINFITGALTFNSGYNWQRGATLEDPSIDIGNIINNNRTFGVNNINFNLVNFYNKFKFLEEVNKKYTASKTASTSVKNRTRNQNAQAAQAQTAKKPPQRKKFEGAISLNPDSATQVKHQLNSKRLRITARGENGKLYALKYKTVNENSIEIKNKDTVNLKITISELPPLDDLRWYKILQGTTRGLMMVRAVGFSYNESFDMMIPNFDPDIGDFFGQGSTPIGNAPGLDFAFGLAGEDYVEKAAKNNWLIKNESNITPAMFNKLQTFNFTATVEPIVGMRITLKAIRSKTDRSEVYFMYGGMPRKFNGNFKMTTVALSGIFESSNANDGYYSKSFETFLNNREVVAGRLEQQYGKTHYPNTGFLEGSHFAGQPYDPSIGSVDPNSTDVLIPAFIAAYTGQNPGSIGLSAFPSLKKLLPNWDIKYDGLMQIPFINKRFKSFTIDHNYVCYYNVGAFNSFLNWVEADESGIGFVESVISNNPYPSSAFDITSINITEAFKPLIGAKTTLQNNMSLSLLYNIEKNVNLNVSAYQIVEMKKKDITLDAGYRIENFNKILKIKKTGGTNFNNELNVKAGITYTLMQNLIRKIEDHYTQATSGNSQFTIKLSADYNLSKMITLQAYYDKQISTPLVSATAYPMSKSDFGISIRVSLQR